MPLWKILSMQFDCCCGFIPCDLYWYWTNIITLHTGCEEKSCSLQS